jgi:hypothetical protein
MQERDLRREQPLDEPNAAPDEFVKGMAGLDFPASKSAIKKAVHDKGGLDTEVLHILDRIRDRTYEDAADVGREVRRVYEEFGGLGDGGPAAPSNLDLDDKGLVETMADPRRGEPK